MFTLLTPRYDLLNHIMTLGLDGRWRLKAARECLVAKPARVLDLCCGTSDLVISLSRLAPEEVELVALDFSRPMLRKAIKKAGAKVEKITFASGSASSLPFPDDCFDAIGISFAFRNLTYQNRMMISHLYEIIRVLRRGGRLVILETSQPKSRLIRKLYHLYLRMVSRLGHFISGNRSAYRYLAKSAAGYFSPEELEKMLTSAGLSKVYFRPLLLGATAILTAIK